MDISQEDRCICLLYQYKNAISGECEACTANCLSCTGPGLNECVICNSEHVLVNGGCEKQCLEGFR